MLKHLMIAVSMSALMASGALAQDHTTPEPAAQPATQAATQAESVVAPQAEPQSMGQQDAAQQDTAQQGDAQAGAPGADAGAATAEPASQARSAAEVVSNDPADKCLMSALTLARSAEDKQFADEKLDRIEQMLAKMEDHCDAQQFSEAQATAKDIESAINAQ